MAVDIQGLEARAQEILRMSADNPAMKRELQRIIRNAIGEARRNVIRDAKDLLDNDPREAYKAVRNSVYKQILGGQINILSSKRRGEPTKYIRKRKLDESPKQRGGNRRKRSHETMRIDSYHGGDRGFILRFQNAGTQERETRYGKRGALRERNWFGISSVFQMEAAANKIAEDIERIIATEFKPI